MNHKYNCPECGANEFITEPNQYDILVFGKTGLEVQSVEQTNDYQVFCRECSAQVDLSKSKKEVILKK